MRRYGILSLFPEDEIHRNYRYSALLPTKNNRQQMFGERTETEAMQRIESRN